MRGKMASHSTVLDSVPGHLQHARTSIMTDVKVMYLLQKTIALPQPMEENNLYTSV